MTTSTLQNGDSISSSTIITTNSLNSSQVLQLQSNHSGVSFILILDGCVSRRLTTSSSRLLTDEYLNEMFILNHESPIIICYMDFVITHIKFIHPDRHL